MDCKQALLQPSVQGDLQKAIDWLRAKGIAKATKGNRETKEGLIGIFQDSRQITLVEVNCETDFVAMNQDFQRFVASVGESVHHRGKEIATTTSFSGEEVLKLTPVSTLSSSLFASSTAQKEHANLQEKLGDVISSIRENIVIRRAKTIFATSAQPNHHTCPRTCTGRSRRSLLSRQSR
jgi:translation elongation factor EF-Ts